MVDAGNNGPPDAGLGSHKLTRLLADPEAMNVDLGRLEEVADAERTRLTERLAARLRPSAPRRAAGRGRSRPARRSP